VRATMKEILTAAGALGSTGMIMVPAFTGQTTLGTGSRENCCCSCCLTWRTCQAGGHFDYPGTAEPP